MKYEYKGISNNNLSDFNKDLNKHVNLGWEPFGSISIAGTYGNYHAVMLRRKIKPTKES